MIVCVSLTLGVSAQYKPVEERASTGEELAIALITIGPGDDIYNYFGHNAMMVANRQSGLAWIVNYGTFRFDERMLPDFIQGRLRFWASAGPVEETVRRYIGANRSVRVQELNLSARQKLMIANRLSHDVQPENREYLYDHYRDNCSTRLRDIIDDAIGGQLKRACSRPARLNLRQHTRRHAHGDLLAALVMDFILNDEVDRPIKACDEAFLPAELERQVADVSYRNPQGQSVPLMAKAYTIFEATGRDPVPDQPLRTWPLTLVTGLLMGFGAVVLGYLVKTRKGPLPYFGFGLLHAVTGLVAGLAGVLLFFMSNFTNHLVTHHNENLLLANPVTLLALPFGLFIALGRPWAFRWMRYAFYFLAASSGLLLVLKLLPAFNQDTFLPMTLLIPINFGFALAHRMAAGSPSPK